MIEKKGALTCPHCGTSRAVESIDSGIRGGQAYEKIRCCLCKTEWIEWYSLHYDEFVVYYTPKDYQNYEKQ